MINYGTTKLVAAPVVEPVTLDEAKAHLRVDGDAEDNFISSLIVAARKHFEEFTYRALITQTWRLSLAGWPGQTFIELPKPPLQSVTSIVYRDQDGNSTTWDAGNYVVDSEREPGRVVLKYNKGWPTGTLYAVNPIQVTFEAGYGDSGSDLPEPLRHGLKLLIGHWFENRETMEIPAAVNELIWSYRMY